jgi:hypothetical protein
MARGGDELRLDGNAAAGTLDELFGFEITAALATCDGCGLARCVGELLLYGGAMGAVLRCPACDHLMMCVTCARGAARLDLRGVRALSAAMASTAW